jgi:uncharacterized repeat protein (TIGR01451 family)
VTTDPANANNEASAATAVTPTADLQLTKTDSPDPVQTGDQLTYTLTVHNAGPSTASDVSVSDPLPSNVTLVSASASQGSCSGTTTVTCSLGNLAAGAANDATITLIVTADAGAIPNITNTATVSSSTADPSTGNNQASAQTAVHGPPSADLRLSKSDAPDPAFVGSDVIYTLTVHNAGPDAADAVTVSDPLPTGMSLVAATSTQGTCAGTSTVSCDLGTVNAGTANEVVVTIVVAVDENAIPGVTNTATVSSSTADPDSSNNQASAETAVGLPPSADVQLSQVDSPDPVDAGNDLTYTLTVHNAGPDTATGVSVSDSLPPGVTLVSATPSQGTCSGTTTVSCNLGSLAAGTLSDATVTLVVTPDRSASPSLTNTATVSATTGDPDSSNNQADTETAINVPPSADLSLDKSDSPDPVQTGSDITYTLVVHNEGPDAAASVTVTDPLPAGLSVVSASSTQGTCDGTETISCDLGTVPAGVAGDVTITIVVTASEAASPGVTNTATVSSATPDPSSSNNQASAHTTVDRPTSADLELTKTDSPDPVQNGEDITYTLTVHNSGPDPAIGTSVADTLPPGLTLVSASSTQGTCTEAATITCDLGTVDAGTANDVVVTIVATTGQGASPGVSNSASVTSSTPDPSASNNQSSADTAVDVPVSGSYARPRGATPLRVSLVPAYRPCTSGNTAHGSPLAFDACNPPLQASSQLTMGTPDANSLGANASGFVAMKVATGNPATPADEADVNLVVSLTDVRKMNDLSDYGGELDARATIRLTDRLSGPSEADPATVTDFDLEFAVPCATTPSATIGATCSVTTSADAVTPGMVVERARAVWQVGRIEVDDGGTDGLAATNDNDPFVVQGVFVP